MEKNLVIGDQQEKVKTPSFETCSSFLLSKLIFLVGHVAIKQIVHLEIIEAAWKRQKAAEDKVKNQGKVADDIDQVMGSAEDELADAILFIREKELLYGEKSLLALFSPIVVTICKNNTSFNV